MLLPSGLISWIGLVINFIAACAVAGIVLKVVRLLKTRRNTFIKSPVSVIATIAGLLIVFSVELFSRGYAELDYGDVAWGMTVEEVQQALRYSGRTGVRTEWDDYSKWYYGADFGIEATYSPQRGVDLWELYLFKEEQDSHRRILCCVEFTAKWDSASQYVYAMIAEKYGKLVGNAANVTNRELLNLKGRIFTENRVQYTYSIRDGGVQTDRTTGIVHIATSTANGITQKQLVDLTLIPAWDNTPQRFSYASRGPRTKAASRVEPAIADSSAYRGGSDIPWPAVLGGLVAVSLIISIVLWLLKKRKMAAPESAYPNRGSAVPPVSACPNCGSAVPPENTYCEKCGSKVRGA